MGRSSAGVILGALGGIIFLAEASLILFANVFIVRIVVFLIGWYIVAVGIGLLVLLSALMVQRGRRVLGGRIMLATSIGAPVTNLALLLIPGPVGSMIPILYYQPLFVSNGLVLSLIGGILILSTKTKEAL